VDKETYLRYLRALLATRISEREAEEAVRYYTEYFQEAGPEREAEVIASLGNPEELAKRIVEQREQESAPPKPPRVLHSWKAFPPPRVYPWKVLLALAAGIFVVRMASGAVFSPHTEPPPEISFRTEASDEVERIAQMDIVSVDEGVEIATVVEGTAVEQGLWGKAVVSGDSRVPFQVLDINVEVGGVTVSTGSDYTVNLNWDSGHSAYTLQSQQEGGSLQIWSEGKVESSLSSLNSAWIDITIPEDTMLENVTIHTGLGDVIWIAPCAVAGQVDISTNMGDVTWEAEGESSVNTLNFHSDMGDVYAYFNSATALRAEFSSHMGDVTVEGMQSAELTAWTNMGDVEIQLPGGEPLAYVLDASMGETYVNGDPRGKHILQNPSNAGRNVTGRSDMGDVSLGF